MAGMNAAAGSKQTYIPRPTANAGNSGTVQAGNGNGNSLAANPTDTVTLGGGLSTEMQNMNQLRLMAGKMPTLREMRQNQRFEAQGECVRASGKSADEIAAMDPMGSDFRKFQSDISLCTDTRVMIQDMNREKAIKENGGSEALQKRIQELMKH